MHNPILTLWRHWRRRIRKPRLARPRLSPLTKRILAVNVISLLVLLAGMLYLDQSRKSLIRSEREALQNQAKIFADVLGEVAVSSNPDSGASLSQQTARDIIRRSIPPSFARARLYDANGNLLLDSRMLGGRKGRRNSIVQIETLDKSQTDIAPFRFLGSILDGLGMQTTWSWQHLPVYSESTPPKAKDYPEVMAALDGQSTTVLRRLREEGDIILTAAVPIQHYRQVVGVLLISKTGEQIEQIMAEIWAAILQIFILALAVTLLLSMYLANALSRPILKLADAARRMRQSRNRSVAIPDLSARQDEIGELSTALRELTQALWQRLDAIENFAADVAHEIKNPLNSLRSAVETANRITDPASQKKLLAIILDDVQRLDRLITDIAEASRVDSDLSKAETKNFAPIDLLAQLLELYRPLAAARRVRLELLADPTQHVILHGVPGRLTQVLRNILDNALSFSPPDGVITVEIKPNTAQTAIIISDAGPGIPPDRLDKIFDRFYTDRPSGEKFGQHSGLGLSIARQIIAAMGGVLLAENIIGGDGKTAGARFIINLPSSQGS